MKKIILFLLVSLPIYSQKIIEDKIDDFTNKSIVRTEWEKISSNSDLYLNVRISKIDGTCFLELKFFPKGVSSIDTKDDMSFMLESGEVINLRSTKYQLSNYGDGAIGIIGSQALGFHIDCLVSEADIQKFKNNLIKKIRINKSEGYAESDIKPKFAEKFRGLFQVVYK